MNREDFVKRFEESKGRALSVELEKFEKKNGEGLETLINKFLANAYNSYDTNEKLNLNILLTTVIPAGKWEKLDYNPYGDMYAYDSDTEYKEDVIDAKKEISVWYERTVKSEAYKKYNGLHDVLKMFVKELLVEKGYFIIEKLEPAYEGINYDRDSYKYLEVYYDEQIYKYEYQGVNSDVKAMIKEIERLLVVIKEVK